jgi:hypothetical protein
MDFHFTLTTEQCNLVLEVLGTAPYNKVAGVITEMQKQAQAQVRPQLVPEPKQAGDGNERA